MRKGKLSTDLSSDKQEPSRILLFSLASASLDGLADILTMEVEIHLEMGVGSFPANLLFFTSRGNKTVLA